MVCRDGFGSGLDPYVGIERPDAVGGTVFRQAEKREAVTAQLVGCRYGGRYTRQKPGAVAIVARLLHVLRVSDDLLEGCNFPDEVGGGALVEGGEVLERLLKILGGREAWNWRGGERERWDGLIGAASSYFG